MKRSQLYVTLALAGLFGMSALGIGAAILAETPPTIMSRAEFAKARGEVEAESRRALGACRGQRAAERELCRAQARAAERVRKAEVVARYHGTIAAAQDVRAAKLRGDFEIERARCAFRGDGERAECLRAARQAHARAVAAARDDPSAT